MEQYWVTWITEGSNKYEIFCVGLDAPPPPHWVFILPTPFHAERASKPNYSSPYSDLV